VNSRKLLILIAADCVLIPTVMFGIVVVTAADQPTRTQLLIALFLVAVLLTLILALIAMIVLILRRRTRPA
jgi:hypothetical protein